MQKHRLISPRSITTPIKRVGRAGAIAALRGIVWASGPAIRRLGRRENLDGSRDGAPALALIRLDLLGDVVFTLPAAHLIKQKWPQSRVTMVTLPQTAGLAELSPDVDRVVPIDTNAIRSLRGLCSIRTLKSILQAVTQLRGQRFSATVSIYGLTASLVALLTRSSKRLGYKDEAYAGALDQALPGGRSFDLRRRHDWELTRGLVESVTGMALEPGTVAPEAGLGSEVRRGDGRFPDAYPRIDVHEQATISAGVLLEGIGLKSGRPLVVVHAGSRYGDFKRWPAAAYARVGRELTASGCFVVLVGAEADAELADEIGASAGVPSLAGRTTIEELCAILERADLVISGDSGPLHIASALGAKVIGIYGPTDPEVNGPKSWRGQQVRVLRRDIACSPCYSVRVRAECPLGDPVCMRLVLPETVIGAAVEMLDLPETVG